MDEYEVLLIGGPAAGMRKVVRGGTSVAVGVVGEDGLLEQHYYRVEPMKFMGEDEAKMVMFGLYGKMTIEEALQELWGTYEGG